MDNFTPGNKYCPNCGAPNPANARFCVRCGAAFGVPAATAQAHAQPQYNPAQPQYTPAPAPAQPQYAPVQAAQPVQSNGKATAGFVLSLLSFLGLGITFVMPLLGIIFSGLGISRAKTANSGKGLAVAGLVLGILSFVWAAAYYIFILPMMFM